MNGINNISSFESFKSLSQNKQVKILKDFIKTLKRVNYFTKECFKYFKVAYPLLSNKKKKQVVTEINNKIKELREENKNICKEEKKIKISDSYPLTEYQKTLETKVKTNDELIEKLRILLEKATIPAKAFPIGKSEIAFVDPSVGRAAE